MNRLDNFENHLIAFLVGVVAGVGSLTYIGLDINSIPDTKKVQQNYIAPSKLEIKCEDLDANGEKETIIKVDDKSYLFKYDKNNNPVLLPYRVEPGKTIPDKIIYGKTIPPKVIVLDDKVGGME